jgi:hypothetical protein
MKNNPNFKIVLEPPDVLPWLAAFFNARYQDQPTKSLIEVYKVHGSFLEWDSDQLEVLFQRRDAVLAWAALPGSRDRLAEVLAEMTLALAGAHGRTLPITDKNIRSLKHIYLQALHETLHLLATAELRNWQPAYRMLLKCHFVRLQAVLAALSPRGLAGEWLPARAEPGVLSAEYAAEWQMKMLGLGAEAPTAPILDLGCGARANLARFFQAQSVEIYGVDRAVAPENALIKSDWFDFPYKPDRWGTVISHLAFSSYFWLDHLNPKGESEKYLNTYMAVLSSLKIGGQFIYFPSLPFLEKLLPAQRYQCRYLEIPDLPGTQAAQTQPLFAAHIKRLA